MKTLTPIADIQIPLIPDLPHRYGEGRVCHEDGCETRLSVYNPGRFCCLHEAGHMDVDRELLIFGGKVCSGCGHQWPASPDFFHRDDHEADELSHWCKGCRNLGSRTTYRKGAA